MSEEIKENGLSSEINEVKETKFSWNKLFCWVSLILSITVPVASIGLSIICLSSINEENDKEGCALCYISIAIGAYFVLSDLVTSIFVV